MKKILIALFIVFAVSSCSPMLNFGPSDNPGSTDNPDTTDPDTPSTNPDTPSTPSTNIPNIPGAPDINTNQEFVVDYISQMYSNCPLQGPSAVSADIYYILVDSFTVLDRYWTESTGKSIIEEAYEENDNVRVQLSPSLSVSFDTGMDSSNAPYVRPTFSYSRHFIDASGKTVTLWGTLETKVGPDAELNTQCQDSDISLIIDINGQRFSFVSTDFNMDINGVTGSAYINGNICYFNFQMPDPEPVPDYTPVTNPDLNV